MHNPYNIDPVIGFVLDTSESDTQPNLVSTVATEKCTIIITDTPYPFIAEWPYNNVVELYDPKKLLEIPTAFAISMNSQWLALGYESGTINIVDIDKRLVVKTIKRNNKGSVTKMMFSGDSNALVVCNSTTCITIYYISQTLGIVNAKECEIELQESVINAFLPDSKVDNIIVQFPTGLFVAKIKQNQEENVYTPFHKIEEGEFISFDADYYDQTYIAVKKDRQFCVYAIDSYGDATQLSENSMYTNIRKIVNLTNGVYVLILADQTLQIIKASGKYGDHCTGDGLESAVKNATVVFASHQKLYLMNDSATLQISFLDWGALLQIAAQDALWLQCFELAIDIFTGRNIEFFGVPTSVKKRCSLVRTTMQAIFDTILKKEPNNVDILTRLMTTAGVLEMSEYVTRNMMAHMKSIGQTEHYFDVMLDKKNNLSRFFNDECLETLFTLPMDRVIEMLLGSDVLERFRGKVYDYAMQKQNKDLLVKLWTEVFGDYLSPCIYLYNTDDIFPFVETAFLGGRADYVHKAITLVWLFTPSEAKFPRLKRLLSCQSLKWKELTAAFFEQCPVIMRDGTILSRAAVVDAFIRTLVELTNGRPRQEIEQSFKILFPILDIVCQVILDENLVIPLAAVKMLLIWIFTETECIDTREHTLQLINCSYPDIVKLTDLLPACEAVGFSTIINSFYMSDKSYHLVIQTLAGIPSRRDRIFPFIYEHIEEKEEIRNAIKTCFQLLILIDQKETVQLVFTHWPEFHRQFMNLACKPYVRYLYLKALDESDFKNNISADDAFTYFTLVCQFCPEAALPMLKASHTIMFDVALPICMRYRVVDACVHIHTMLGDNQSAVKLIAEELEQELVEVIHSKKPVYVTSIDRVGDDPNLRKPYQTILLSFDLLDKTPELGMMLDEMWRDIFKAFQLPLYLVQSAKYKDAGPAFNLFFAFFLVEVIPKTSPDFVMMTMNRDFRILTQEQFKAIYGAVFNYLDYQKMLGVTVRQLLLEDCTALNDAALLTKTSAAPVWSTRCGTCQQFITGQGGVGMLVFQCGHCFHNNLQCGGHNTCPVCRGTMMKKDNDTDVKPGRKGRGRGRVLERVEYGLRRHYGQDQDESSTGAYVYFLPDMPVKASRKAKLQLPEELPAGNTVFMEM